MPTEEEIRGLVKRVVEELVPEPESPEEIAGRRGMGASEHSDTEAVAIGADHGGYPLKERIGFKLREHGFVVHDCGTTGPEAVDYPDFAHEVARKVADGECSAGIIVDGAGIGSAIAANKVPGVRAALCYDVSSARNSREHNHANVLTLGAGLIGENLAWQIVEAWLATEWAEGRHARRVGKIGDIERRYLKAAE